MIDPTIRQRVEQLARTAAHRTQAVDYDALFERLCRAATSPRLAERLAGARSERWAGAAPTWEAPDTVRAASALPVDMIGIDGSQIYPADRGMALWAYVQAVAYRKQCAPLFESQLYDLGADETGISPDLAATAENLRAMTNAWRTLLEMRLAHLAAERHPGVAVFFDNGLLPWLSVAGQNTDAHLRAYLADLLAIRPGLIAGVISGPQSRLFARLIHLVEAETLAEGIVDPGGVRDALLMRHILEIGERSALFTHSSPRNEIFYQEGAGVCFFFLRIDRQEVVRVEIPEWIARDEMAVDVVQATVLEDARSTGYSYVLTQAHWNATVPAEVGQQLQNVAAAVYLQETGTFAEAPSAKRRMKRA